MARYSCPYLDIFALCFRWLHFYVCIEWSHLTVALAAAPPRLLSFRFQHLLFSISEPPVRVFLDQISEQLVKHGVRDYIKASQDRMIDSRTSSTAILFCGSV